MTEPTTVEDAVELVALGMVSETAEGNRSQKNIPIKDLIEADGYLIGKRAASKPHMGLRFTKLIPPGGG
jgi:hypothetical protein